VNSRVSCLLFGIPSLQPEFELYFLGDRHHLLTDCAPIFVGLARS
jgi:hypothetical protein